MKSWIHRIFVWLAFGSTFAPIAYTFADSATVPGFEVPAEIGSLKPMKSICAGSAQVGFRVCKKSDFTIIEYYEGQNLLGQIKYSNTTAQTVWVSEIQVDERARGRGLSTFLFKKMLEQVGPGVTEISAQLAATNYKTTLTEYYNITTPGQARYQSDLISAEANVIAIQASPFAKALDKLGFNEVTRAKLEWVTMNGPPYVSQILITVTRSAPSCPKLFQ